MITRKRQHSPSSEAKEHPLKRSILIPNTASTLRSSTSDQSSGVSSGGIAYPIQDIIAESQEHFLIDWEDDPVTGQKYSPSWQPKDNVSSQAIAVWKGTIGQIKQPSAEVISRQQPLASGSRRGTKSIPSSQSDRRRKLRPRKVASSSSGNHQESTLGRFRFPPPRSKTARVGDLVVQISQHSSFDRDQYIQYQSSVSTDSLLSTVPPHPDSGLGDSSPRDSWHSPGQGKPTQPCIIPDSQSLPGSSSYEALSSISQSSIRTSASILEVEESESKNTGHREVYLTRSRKSHSDQSEVTSGFYVVESPEYTERFRRSQTSPAEIQIEHLEPSWSRTKVQTILTRSKSDSGSLTSYTEEGSLHSVAALGRSCPVVSNLSSSPHSSSKLVISQSAFNSPYSGILRVSANKANTASELPNDVSQASSYPRVVSPDQARLQYLATSQRQHERLQSFIILEDTTTDSQVNRGVDHSILSERHPNSLSESPSQSSLTGDRDKRKSSGISIISVREPTSISKDPATGFVITDVLDSKRPALASGFNDMSQPSPQASTPFQASSEIPGSGLREKLRNLRAGSRVDAEDRKSNRRRFDHAQSASIHNDLTVRANVSQSVESSTSISRNEQEPANKLPDSPSVREVAQVSSSFQSAPRSPLPTRQPAQGYSSEKRTSINKPEDAHNLTPQGLAQEYGRIETQPLQVPPDIPLPLRVPQNDSRDAEVQNQPVVPEELSSLSQVITPLHPQHLGKAEFVIPLGMNSRVRDQYVSIINYYARSIDDWQQQQIDTMLDRLNRVTTHTDLDDGMDPIHIHVKSADFALWAENCSEKFRFLHHLFDAFRNRAFHLAVVARPGPTLDIVETFLKGHHVAYSRPDNFARSDPSEVTGRLEVTLLPSGVEGSAILPSVANLVIALDGSFNAQDMQVVKLRAHLTRVDELAPVIHLLVYNSAEHIGRCISTTLDPADRVRKIVSCLTQTGDDVGVLLPEEPSPSAAAEEVVAFVEGGCNDNDWLLLPIRPIEGTVAIEFTQAAETTRTDTQITTGQKVVAPSAALKRALESDDFSLSHGKRQRMTPVPDVTQISDSATQDSQPQTIADLRSALREAKAENSSLKTSHNQRENELQSVLRKNQLHLREHVAALTNLQDRYENRGRKLDSVCQERDALTAAATASERQRVANTAEIASVKETNAKLETDLKQAREMLLGSTILGVGDFEKANAEIRRLEAENAGYEKKLVSMRKDFDFTRSAYQTASSSAAESAMEINNLQSEIAELRSRASTNLLELAERNKKDDNETLVHNISRLEFTLADREELLRRKEEELKELKRGRGMGTRGSSVLPGSPRGSRGASPVGGEAMLKIGSKGLGSNLRFGARAAPVRGEEEVKT